MVMMMVMVMRRSFSAGLGMMPTLLFCRQRPQCRGAAEVAAAITALAQQQHNGGVTMGMAATGTRAPTEASPRATFNQLPPELAATSVWLLVLLAVHIVRMPIQPLCCRRHESTARNTCSQPRPRELRMIRYRRRLDHERCQRQDRPRNVRHGGGSSGDMPAAGDPFREPIEDPYIVVAALSFIRGCLSCVTTTTPGLETAEISISFRTRHDGRTSELAAASRFAERGQGGRGAGVWRECIQGQLQEWSCRRIAYASVFGEMNVDGRGWM